MDISFENSLKEYMPIYYYFLDGYINPNVMYSSDKIYNFILNNNITPICNDNTMITFLNYEINYLEKTINLIFKFYNKKERSYKISIDKLEDNCDISEIMELFTYCIWQSTNNSHITSLLFFIKDNCFNVASFNSGDGIGNHEIITRKDHRNYYSPYKGITISNDYINNKIKCLKNILSFLVVSELYNQIVKIEENIITVGRYYKEVPQKYDDYYNVEYVYDLVIYLKLLLPNINLRKRLFDFEINNISLDNLHKIKKIKIYYHYGNKEGYRYENKKASPIEEEHYYMQKSDTRITPQTISYYKIITTLFSDRTYDILKLSTKYNFDEDMFNTMNLNIKNKLILHYENNYYIYEQESSSCSWFSAYWPILFYNIFNFNECNYYETVLNIYNKMIILLNRIFNDKSLLLCFEDNDDNYKTMKLLCEKFVNIKLLDSELLIKQNNIIYDYPFSINRHEDIIKHNTYFERMNKIIDEDKETLFENNNIILFLNKLFNEYIIQDEWAPRNSSFEKLEVLSFNDTIILIKELFNYQEINNQPFFNDTAPPPVIFAKLFDFSVNHLKMENKQEIDMFENKQYIYNIDNIPFNITNYLKQFIDTYDDCYEPDPMYIKNYIHWATTLIDFECEYDKLRRFITFIHRFSLFILIIRVINNIIKIVLANDFNSEKNQDIKNLYTKNLYEKIILPLLNKKNRTIIINKHDDFIKLRMSNIYYETKYINHLINVNNVLIKRNQLSSSGEFIVMIDNEKRLKQCEGLFENYSRSIEDYILLKQFLYEQPKYIHTDFNENELIIDTNQFVKLNIKEICSNILIRNRLIQYYSIKYYEKVANDINNELLWIISNLQLLICEKIGYYNDDEDNLNIFIYNVFVYEYSDISFKEFKNILNNIIINKSKEEFITYLIQHRTELIINPIDIIKSHLDNNIEYNQDTKVITIEYNNYDIININNNKIIKYFNIIPRSICLLNHDNNDIYIFNNKLYIQFICEYKDLQYKINHIKINNKDVIKYDKIIYPFKHVIPKNSFHLIYRKNYIYYITYLINHQNIRNKFYQDNNLLGTQILSPDIYTISINKNNMMYPNLDNNIFKLLCLDSGLNNFNIIYQNKNDTEYNILNFTYLNNKYFDEFKFNKENFMTEELIIIDYNKIELLNYDSDSLFKMVDKDSSGIKYSEYSESIKKLLFKIKKCLYKFNKFSKLKSDPQKEYDYDYFDFEISKSDSDFRMFINYILNKMIKLRNLCWRGVVIFSDSIKDKNFDYLFNNYSELYNYLLLIKKINICNILLEIIKLNKIENFCSQIKILNDMFNIKKHSFKFKFEAMFELINGNEIYDEQMERYASIVSKHNEYISLGPYPQMMKKNSKDTEYILDFVEPKKGGGVYPLHHIMMAKGKSSVITPLLTLYFNKINRKKILIIVPDHLVNQTKDTLLGYIDIFNMNIYSMETNFKEESEITIDMYNRIFREREILIFSDTKIKELFLLKIFEDRSLNKDIIMLIDEFDYILDPIKSNLNITDKKTLSVMKEFHLLNPIGDINGNIESIYNGNINDNNDNYSDEIYNLIKDNIKKIVHQIHTNKLKENINWGIHPNKCIAIPFRCKNVPLLTSNFSSVLLTIYLTLYYYIYIKKYRITETIVNFININNIYVEFFHSNKPIILSIEMLESIINKRGDEYRLEFFNFLFHKIFNEFKIASKQTNTSFVDIINIDNIYKIGYSGTININLPLLKPENMFDIIVQDFDENINVEYAIVNSIVVPYLNKMNPYFFEEECINLFDYDAIIDITGLFKNENNEIVAMRVHSYFNRLSITRDIIYISENNKKYVIKENNKIYDYDNFSYYNKPFIFYSQAHTIGIDIKQDLYPNMKGLCIIDKLTKYSEIAQGIFRLRKINMGHSVDFLLLGDYITSEELLCIINENENNYKIENKKFLIYQTIKSNLRKITKNYEEEIKYYYINYEKTINDILKNIIPIYEHIKKLKKLEQKHKKQGKDVSEKDIIIKLYEEINDISIIRELVYNLDSLGISTERSVEKSEETSTERASAYEKNIIINHNDYLKIFDINLLYDYYKYDFNILDYNIDTFRSASIKLTESIYYLPNIFTNSNSYRSLFNYSGYLFVYFYKFNKILIIPGYLLMYFYNKYPILNYQLILINNNFIHLYDKEIISKFLEEDLFKILNNERIKDNDTLSAYIALLIFSNNNLITQKQLDIYNFFKDPKNKGIKIKYIGEISEILKNDYFSQMKIKYIDRSNIKGLIKIDDAQYKKLQTFKMDVKKSKSSYNKYIKYKLKYINLKNTIKI